MPPKWHQKDGKFLKLTTLTGIKPVLLPGKPGKTYAVKLGLLSKCAKKSWPRTMKCKIGCTILACYFCNMPAPAKSLISLTPHIKNSLYLANNL